MRESFQSGLGSVLALAGSAVGLGNIWRFPYMLSEYGGGAFLLVYIVCVIVVALPIMLSEFLVGRRSRVNAFSSVRKLEPTGPWKYFGFLAVFIPFATLCYYCVIGGWTMEYLAKSCFLEFGHSASADAVEAMFGAFVTSSVKPIFCHMLFLLATGLIIMLGVRKGIESFSKVMMPLLFVIMIVIALRSMTLPGAGEGIKYLFAPDFSKITPQVWLAAMGQAFYSLSIGMGIMITYSSYLDKDANLVKTAGCTIASDFIFAVIAGCAIIPALFAYGMPTNQGTGLVFKTLPVVFTQMPMGNAVGIVFFFAVLLAALTSSMSLFEVPVSWLVEQKSMPRKKACILVFFVALVIGAICSMSFGRLSFLNLNGKVLFDIFDYTIGNYLMPLAGLVIVLFVGWKMKKEDVRDEIFNGRFESAGLWRKRTFAFLDFSIKYLSPAAIIAIFLSGILK